LIPFLERRPIVVALAGPNGAGNGTFFDAHPASAGLRFVNTDVVARELDIEVYAAARLTNSRRRELVRQGEPSGSMVAHVQGIPRRMKRVARC
jgi:ABC-type cobalamin transport system ATPase subunit